MAGSLLAAIGISYLPGIIDVQVDLTKTGKEAAIAAKSEYENLCKQNKMTENPCDRS